MKISKKNDGAEKGMAVRKSRELVHRGSLILALALLAIVPQFAVAAVAIKFRPGAVDCDVTVNRMDSTAALADIEQFEDVSSFQFALINDALPAVTGLPDDKHVFMNVVSTTNSLPLNAPFETTFAWRLVSINGPGGKIYGLDDAMASIFTDNSRSALDPTKMRFPTHVFMTASIKGKVRAARSFGSFAVFDIVKANPEFTEGKFRMFYDVDGNIATTGDQKLIAKFGSTIAPEPQSSFASTTFIDQAVGSVLVHWDSALPNVFADQNGNEIVTPTKDPADTALRLISPTIPSAAVAEFDFRFACATAGPCSVLSGNNLRFRLNVLQGDGSVTAVPAGTSPSTPTSGLCGPKVEPKDKTNAKCFPFAYCPFPYFGIIVLTLIAIVVVVVIVAIAKKSQGVQKG